MSDVAAIVLAAGSGTRMAPTAPHDADKQAGTKKQFVELMPGIRVVDQTIATCAAVCTWIGLVLPPTADWDGPAVDAVVAGGPDRLGSLAAGVAALPPEAEIVVVHSASHPLASINLVDRVVASVRDGAHAVVPVLAAVDTIKRFTTDGRLVTVGREGFGSSQSPMAYDRTMLERALNAPGSVVEESIAVEAIGGIVVAVDGELTNLHLTDQTSLRVIRALAALDLDLPTGDRRHR